MFTNQLSSIGEQALRTKMRILSKYKVAPEQLDSIYDLIFGNTTNTAFSLYRMSAQDQHDLINAIQTVFSEVATEKVCA